jgi:hypothetical protein
MTQGCDNKAGITSEPLSICVILVMIVNNAFVGAMIGLEQTNRSAIDWQGSIWNRIQTTDLNNTRRTYREPSSIYNAPIKDQ